MVQSSENDSKTINSGGDYTTDQELTIVTIKPLRVLQHASVAPDTYSFDTKVGLRRFSEVKWTAKFLYLIDLHTLQKRAHVGIECRATH